MRALTIYHITFNYYFFFLWTRFAFGIFGAFVKINFPRCQIRIIGGILLSLVWKQDLKLFQFDSNFWPPWLPIQTLESIVNPHNKHASTCIPLKWKHHQIKFYVKTWHGILFFFPFYPGAKEALFLQRRLQVVTMWLQSKILINIVNSISNLII